MLRLVPLAAALALFAVLAPSDAALAQQPSPYPRAAALDPATQRTAAGRAVAAMKATLDAARARFESAREAEDLVQLNCVGEKLAALKGLLRTAEESAGALAEAIEQGERLLADHAFTRVSVAAERVAELRLEVESCVGATSRYAGETSIDLDVAPGVRADDPSQSDAPPVFTAINTERPPAVSGSR
ncbi:MAG: hypothetical protein H6703_07270 [Myxococcales bacterium]|nr:hypothetical protein [Myxococcales bacterium]